MSAISFLAGMGAGYLNQTQKNKELERQDRLDKQQEELHAAKMAEIKRNTDNLDALKVATAPATVREMEGPQTEQAYAQAPGLSDLKPLGYIAGNGASAKGFAEKGIADANAVEQNKPEAARARLNDLAMQGNTYAATALDVVDKQDKRVRDATTFDQAQIDRVRTLREEGVFDAAAAMRRGDVAGFEGAFNKTGNYTVSNTTVTQEVMDVGGQKVPTFTYTFDLHMPDGTVKRETRNSHTTSMALMPYEKLLDLQQKETKAAVDATESNARANYYNAYADALKPGGTKDKWGASSIARGGVGGSNAEPVAFDPLAGFDSKKQQAVAFEQAAREAEMAAGSGKPMTAQEQGVRANELYRSTADAWARENTRRHVATTASAELRATSNDPAQYAATYGKAMSLGMSNSELMALGFKPPVSKAVMPASTTQATPIPKADATSAAKQEPKEGDTRTVSGGRGSGTKTQILKKSGRGGVTFTWVDQ